MTDDATIPAPHAPIAEKSILSMMFRNPANIARAAAEGIDHAAFHIPAHRIILERLKAARDAGMTTDSGEIDLSVFAQQAHMDGLLQRMGGPSEVYAIASYALDSSGWSSFCEQLRECKARRIAQDASERLSSVMDSEEAIKAARDALEAISGAIRAKTRAMNAKQACEEFIQSYVQTFENGDIPGVSTGIGEIDAITGGAKPGELWVIGGPSSSGKSVLMYQVASEFLGEGKTVAIFSAELMAREVVGRLVTLKARVPYAAITTPKEVTKHEMAKVQAAVKEMATTRLWIDAAGNQTIDSIFSEAERIRDIEGRVDLVVVDYIQIVRGHRNKGDSREMEIASISGGLKQLAKKMECPVITGTQLNDDGKTRESRAIEQDADVLMLIQPDGILMKKVRNGARNDTIPLALDGSQQRFRHYL
jgi:replicative DNA helicase